MDLPRRIALTLSLLLLSTPAFGVVTPAAPPPWFPKIPDAALEASRYWAYDESHMFIDKSSLPKNEGGYRVMYGKAWEFHIKPADGSDCSKTIYPALWDQLKKVGFTFVQPGHVMLKGQGEHAQYIYFGGCYVRIAEVAPNPFHVELRPPAKAPEHFEPTDAVPYVAPIPGSKLVSGKNDLVGSWPEPGCVKREERGTTKTTREYQAPAELSNRALLEAYEAAFKAAGWDEVCRSTASEMDARFSRNGRDIGVYIRGDLTFNRSYSMTVVDTGSGLRNDLKKGCKAAVYGVNFDFDKATLRPDSGPALNQLLAVLQESPNLVVEIGGHTDDVGQHEYNLKLSDARAATVRQWLVAHGIPAKRLTSHGYGDTQPLVPNSSDENRAKNRRVEVKRTGCK